MTQYEHIVLLGSDDIQLAEQILRSRNLKHDLNVFIAVCYECFNDPPFNFNLLNAWLQTLSRQHPSWRLFLILDHFYTDQASHVDFVVDGILHIDYTLYLTGRKLIREQACRLAYRWPRYQTRFLCLAGRPFHMHRLGLLYRLHQKGLLSPDRCVWSMFNQTGTAAEYDKYGLIHSMPELDYDTIMKFHGDFQMTHGSMGRIFNSNLTHQDDFWINRTWIWPVSLYTSTSFSVVPESFFRSVARPEISEKTYTAILNYHPFIVAGDTNSCRKLNQMGIVTFDKFLKRPEYDSIEDNLDRLQAVVENTAHWVTHLHQHEHEINDMTKYNVAIFHNLYAIETQKIQQFMQHHNITIDIDDFILDEDRYIEKILCKSDHLQRILDDKKFVEFYNAVRDESWPVCKTESDFQHLPEPIKQELISVYGYVKP